MTQTVFINPEAIAQPVGSYSHATLCQGTGRWLQLSGQIGMSPDGSLPPGVIEQAENVWCNVEAVLVSAGMSLGDLVKITTYVTEAEDLALAGRVRARYLGGHRPASTVVVAKALAVPEWRIEVEAVAYQAQS